MWFKRNRLLSIVNYPRLNLLVNERFQSSLSVVFYGSDVFSLASLRKLHDYLEEPTSPLSPGNQMFSDGLRVKRLEVVTKNDCNHVARFARSKGLLTHHWPCRLKPNLFDLGVVVSFGHLIDGQSISSCKYGMINVHPSLLPKYRGSTPIQRAVYNGDKETGVTIVTIEPKKFDIGRILIQERVSISDEAKAIDLRFHLAQLGSSLMLKSLEKLDSFLSTATPQTEVGVSYAVKLKKTDGFIDWTAMSSAKVDRIFRAYDGFIPIYCDWTNGDPLTLMDMVDLKTTRALDWDHFESTLFGSKIDRPGLVTYNPRLSGTCFKCADNRWVVFRRLGLKNYAKMAALDFKNGFISKQRQPLVLSKS